MSPASLPIPCSIGSTLNISRFVHAMRHLRWLSKGKQSDFGCKVRELQRRALLIRLWDYEICHNNDSDNCIMIKELCMILVELL